VLYVVSPIQLIPNFIPVLGQLDDVLVVAFAMRVLNRHTPPTVLKECQDGRSQFARFAEVSEATTLITEVRLG